MTAPRIHVVLLAAGRSTRSGQGHKLLARIDDKPLIRRAAETALAAKASGVTVVLGYRTDELRTTLSGLPLAIVVNGRFAEGLSASLVAGFAARPDGTDGVLVMLADQPLLESRHLDRLIEGFRMEGQGSIVVATDQGRRFNPAIVAVSFADEIERLSGDVGARSIFARHPDAVREIEIGRPASFDVDTPAALREVGATLESSSRDT